MGAGFDGSVTEMTYCVTGLDAPGFGPALSPDVPELEPGEYALVMALEGMSGWREATRTFTVPEE